MIIRKIKVVMYKSYEIIESQFLYLFLTFLFFYFSSGFWICSKIGMTRVSEGVFHTLDEGDVLKELRSWGRKKKKKKKKKKKIG